MTTATMGKEVATSNYPAGFDGNFDAVEYPYTALVAVHFTDELKLYPGKNKKHPIYRGGYGLNRLTEDSKIAKMNPDDDQALVLFEIRSEVHLRGRQDWQHAYDYAVNEIQGIAHELNVNIDILSIEQQ